MHVEKCFEATFLVVTFADESMNAMEEVKKNGRMKKFTSNKLIHSVSTKLKRK